MDKVNSMSSILQKADQKQSELYKLIQDSKTLQQRPLFHFATPGGWCNDPNGFSQYQGKVHLFYQYHPYSTQWGPMHWGHVCSEDFLEWKLLPVALAPDSSADCKGCFSGTALEFEGKHILAYTGVSSQGASDFQNQCIAFGDGFSYRKLENNPVITASDFPFEFDAANFRDPKIWRKNNRFYMACVIKQTDGKGAIVMFESTDAVKWNFRGVLDSSKDGLSNMWECPDVSVIDGKDILIFSPQEVKADDRLGFHDGNNSVYVSGKLDYETCTFTRENRTENNYTAALVDYGIDFYAPETTALSDGRTIMIGWMQAWESYITPPDYIWSGMMTLPRELSYRNGRLFQLPVRELEMWKREKSNGDIPPVVSAVVSSATENPTQIFSDQHRHFELRLAPKENASGSLMVSLGKDDEHVFLELDFSENTICFSRQQTKYPGAIPERKTALRLDGNVREIRIICDTCSMEVFLNEGMMAFTNTFFFSKDVSDLCVTNGTDATVSYSLWKIAKGEAR